MTQYVPQVGDTLRNLITDECVEVVSLDPYAVLPIRDPGDYVGVHRLSYSWALHALGDKTFRTNLTGGAHRG